MVLSADTDLLTNTDDNRVLLAASDAKARKHAVEQATAPVPATLVRAYLAEFEDHSVERLLRRYNGEDVIDGWRKGPHSHGNHVVHGAIQGSSWHSLMTTGKLRVSAENAARVLIAADMVPKYDEMTAEVRVVEKLSDASEVRLVSCKAVMFTTPRDFCVCTTVRREPSGRILVATRSVEHPAGVRDGFVRAISHISGFVITPDPVDPNACEMSLIAHMDIGGNMPPFVIKYLGLSAPLKMYEKIQEVVVEASHH